MAPSTDRLLHYTGGLSLALVLVNAVLLSAALLVFCSFCRRKKAKITDSDVQRERPNSELKRAVEIRESNGTNNGVIPPGSGRITKSKKQESKKRGPDRNGSVVKDSEQVSLDLTHRSLPLPPPSADPPELEDSLYDIVKDEQNSTGQLPVHQINPVPNEKHLAHTSGSNLTVTANGGDTGNPEILEVINPLYTSVEEEWKENVPGNQDSVLDLTSPGPNQEPKKEPMNSRTLADEPIYSVICRDKFSVKRSLVIQQENVSKDSGVEPEDLHGGSNHRNTDSPAAPGNPGMDRQIPLTSSIKLNEMIRRCDSRRLKNSAPKITVANNNDLEGPPPLPDRLFDIGKEAGREEQHPNEDNTETDIELEY